MKMKTMSSDKYLSLTRFIVEIMNFKEFYKTHHTLRCHNIKIPSYVYVTENLFIPALFKTDQELYEFKRFYKQKLLDSRYILPELLKFVSSYGDDKDFAIDEFMQNIHNRSYSMKEIIDFYDNLKFLSRISFLSKIECLCPQKKCSQHDEISPDQLFTISCFEDRFPYPVSISIDFY